jgi:2-polyprenyl-3-methyl-5-hydroxy-6-metoxy-1,4-benzoquinol methylase
MNAKSFAPHGAALLDYFNGKTDAVINVFSETKGWHAVPVKIFFRGANELLPFEALAIELAAARGGRALDAGAGSGCHALLLQERGVEVTGLDVVPEAVEIMRRRGLRQAVCADIFTYELPRAAAPFDSILLMMNGTVVIENLARLEPFLRQLRKLAKSDGQVLLSSTDARLMKNPEEGARQAAARLAGKYIGEMRWQMEYAGIKGDEFTGLLVDPETLAAAAQRTGWRSEVLGIMAEGFFLARLVPRARD